ncbi:hypothetical protein, partial [Pedobacter sp.]|uniref:hypothetical protein n=1 Tax=Pedobacter sp. TaxID=1411316 RepID=UPI002C081DE8
YHFSDYISSLIKQNTARKLTLIWVYNRLNEIQGTLRSKDLVLAESLSKRILLFDSLTKSPAIKKVNLLQNSFTSDSVQNDSLILNSSVLLINAQNSIKDNYPLKEIPSSENLKAVYKELKKVLDDKVLLDTVGIITAFSNNKALSAVSIRQMELSGDVNPGTIEMSSTFKSIQQNAQQNVQQAMAPKMAFPSESEIIGAMADYLANRVKTEASLAFFDNLKQKLNGDSILLTLFPNTIALMTSVQTYEAPDFGQQFRNSFAEDFIRIPEKLAGDQDVRKYFENRLSGSKRDYYDFFRMIVRLCSMSRDNSNFIDVISYLNRDIVAYQTYPGRDVGSKMNIMLGNYIQFLHMVNNEFFSVNTTNRYWISYTEFNQLSDDEFQVLMGLLKQKYPEVFKFIQVKLSNDDPGTLPSINELRLWMSRFFFIINQYQVAIQNHNNDGLDQANRHNASSYWTFIGDMFSQFVSKENNFFIVKVDPLFSKVEDLEKYQAYLKNLTTTCKLVTDLYSAVQSKNYPQVLKLTQVLLENMEDPEIRYREIFIKYFFANKNQSLTDFKKWYNSNSHYRTFYLLVKQYQVDIDNNAPQTKLDSDLSDLSKFGVTLRTVTGYTAWFNKTFVDNDTLFIRNFCTNMDWYRRNYRDGRYAVFEKVMSFINDVMLANNSQSLSGVIANYASPPQSYRVKRSSRFSFDLNAYVGIVAGLEGLDRPHFAYGLTAPIGVSFSWSGTKRPGRQMVVNKDGHIVYLRGNSNAISLTIIDIGAAVRYRFANDASSGLPRQVNLSQFISPALQYHFGIKNTPLDVVVGYQYLPKLRTFDDLSSSDNTIKSASEFNIGVVFDLPLMNFYHSK